MNFIESTVNELLECFDFTYEYLDEIEQLEIILSCELIFGISLPEFISTKIELINLINENYGTIKKK